MKSMVFSIDPISRAEFDRMESILRETDNPAEALKGAFPERFHSMEGTNIFFDGNAQNVLMVSRIEY